MSIFSLLAVSVFMKFVAVVLVICAIVLILVVLVQKGKGGGLSGAFGGGMAGGILGSKTGDFLTWATITLASLFLLLLVLMAKFYKPSVGEVGPGQPPTTGQPVSPIPPAATEQPARSAQEEPAGEAGEQ